MLLELSDDDAQLLQEILELVVSDLSPEIANTDNANYRRELRSRRDHVRLLLDEIRGSRAPGQ